MSINTKRRELQKSSDILRAITHPLRLKLVSFIHKEREVNVNSIYSSLGLEQSITSQHLKILRDAGIIYARREGKYIYYRTNYQEVQNVMDSLQSFFKKEAE